MRAAVRKLQKSIFGTNRLRNNFSDGTDKCRFPNLLIFTAQFRKMIAVRSSSGCINKRTGNSLSVNLAD